MSPSTMSTSSTCLTPEVEVDKCLEHISFRVPPTIKEEYDALSEADKKVAKATILDALGRFLWSKHHYDNDARVYYGLERRESL